MLKTLFQSFKYTCSCTDCKAAERCQSTGNTETLCPLGYKPKWVTTEIWNIAVNEVYSRYGIDRINGDAILNIILEEVDNIVEEVL